MDSEQAASRSWREGFDPTPFACTLGASLLIGLAGYSVYRVRNGVPFDLALFAAFFLGAILIPFAAAWWQAVREERLPSLRRPTPELDHIDGRGALVLAFGIGVVVVLAAWATSSDEASRNIQSEWGQAVVFGLAIAFIVAALAPMIDWGGRSNARRRRQPDASGEAAAPPRRRFSLLKLLGDLLSAIDGVVVFAVAGGAGASQASLALRYMLLAGSVAPCAVLGYWLPHPWGLVPIAWGFIVVISISRRWAWVEKDRELAMLNGRFTGPHLRIGFAQDLRDEALLAFMSMFFLVPLALRQAHLWSGETLFEMQSGVDPHDVMVWIGFYGTELAKAVPFVDWAEVYQVHGDDAVAAASPAAQHVVFATRVLVDLVFLAALLQALSVSARSAEQRDLFEDGTLPRLDPFIEPKEFRALVQRGEDGSLAIDQDALRDFPRYDPVRLVELSEHRHREVAFAAKALRIRDGEVDFHRKLLELALEPKKDREAIDEVIVAIRKAGPERRIYELDQARQALNGIKSMNEVRGRIMALIAEAPDSPEKMRAYIDALVGSFKDTIYDVRRIALDGLKGWLDQRAPEAVAAYQAVSQADWANELKRRAATALEAMGLSQAPLPA